MDALAEKIARRRKMIIPSYLEKNARLYPERVAVIFEDRRCSFTELKRRVYRLANALKSLGVKKGDRVAVVLENCFEYPEIYLAIGKIGGVITPVNYRLIGYEIARLVNHAEANTLLVGKDFVGKIIPFITEFTTVKNYICVGKSEEVQGVMDYDELVSLASDRLPSVQVGMEDLFCLSYTGGTTGEPKGVMLTHRNLHSACTTWIIQEGVPRGVAMLVTPIFHIASLWALFFNFMLGNTLVIVRRVDPALILHTVEKEKVNYSLWHASFVNRILNCPDLKKYDLSSLKLVNCGGGPLAPSHLRKLVELLGCCVHYSGGMTESGNLMCVNVQQQLEDDPETLGAAGKESHDVELRIVDEQDNDTPVGAVGELCCRGESIMQGYWKNPEKTAEALRGGWLHTGDLVRMDEKGYIYYVDRKKDIIITGGCLLYTSPSPRD